MRLIVLVALSLVGVCVVAVNALKPSRLYVIGDSIMAQMTPVLSAQPAPIADAYNLATRGNSVAEIVALVPLISKSATAVLVEGGTNDLVGLDDDSNIVPGYTTILEKLTPTKRVILIGIPQIDEAALEIAHPGWTKYLNNARIAAQNAKLIALCKSYTNCNPAIAVMSQSQVGHTIDGIHFQPDNYRTFTANILAAF